MPVECGSDAVPFLINDVAKAKNNSKAAVDVCVQIDRAIAKSQAAEAAEAAAKAAEAAAKAAEVAAQCFVGLCIACMACSYCVGYSLLSL